MSAPAIQQREHDEEAEFLVSYEEAAKQLGVTRRTITTRVKQGKLLAVPVGVHVNGKTELAIPAAMLEGRAGLALAKPGPRKVPVTADGVPDLAALRAMGAAHQAAEFDRRSRAIAALMAARRKAPYGQKTEAAERVAGEYGITLSTLCRWNRLLLEGGPAALVPNLRTTKGKTCLPTELQRQCREFWLTSRRATVAQLFRAVVVPYYAERGQDCPHYCTVRRFVHGHIAPLEVVYHREGKRAYEALGAPKVVRGLPKPGAVWSGDHRLWDVLVVVGDGQGAGWKRYEKLPCPCGSGRQRRRCCSLRRPWITLIADVGSAALVGWRIGTRATAASVCHAARDAILEFGLPGWFCPDRGKEFAAERLVGQEAKSYTEAMQSGLWSALGVEVHKALPYHAWSKPVESLFAAFAGRWENLAPGWTGRDAKERPEQLNVQVRSGTLLTIEQFEKLFAEQAGKWNSEEPIGERKAAPRELYEEHGQAHPPVIPEEQTLSFLIQDERRVTVRQEGVVLEFEGQRFRFWREELALLVKVEVVVRWDPLRPDRVWLYTPGGVVLEVPRAEDAQWGQWGRPNESAARGRKVQKDFLRARAREVAGSTPAARLDPLGAVKMIEEAQLEREGVP